MTNDMIRLAMRRAARRFGGSDGVFNAAGFGLTLAGMAGLRGGVDGDLVAAILCGRSDVEPLRGGAHYRLRPRSRDRMAKEGLF